MVDRRARRSSESGIFPSTTETLATHVPPAVVDAFCAGRLDEAHGRV